MFVTNNYWRFTMSKKVEKTIEMRDADATAWLDALRSGKYKQGTGTLCAKDWNINENRYCCLGVQQAVLGKVQEDNCLPTLRWLKDHKIKVKIASNEGDVTRDGELTKGRNSTVDIVLNPPIKSGTNKYGTVGQLNDSNRFTFKQIANILDKRIKRV